MAYIVLLANRIPREDISLDVFYMRVISLDSYNADEESFYFWSTSSGSSRSSSVEYWEVFNVDSFDEDGIDIELDWELVLFPSSKEKS